MPPSPVKILLPPLVAGGDLSKHIGFTATSARQVVVEQFGDVPCAQQRSLFCELCTHFHREEQCHAHQAHVMVPAAPYSDLILGHSQLALGFVEGVFDPEALALDPGIPNSSRFRRSGCSGCI